MNKFNRGILSYTITLTPLHYYTIGSVQGLKWIKLIILSYTTTPLHYFTIGLVHGLKWLTLVFLSHAIAPLHFYTLYTIGSVQGLKRIQLDHISFIFAYYICLQFSPCLTPCGDRQSCRKTCFGLRPGLLWLDIVQPVQAHMSKLMLPMASATLGNRAWRSLRSNRWRHIEAHGQIRPTVCRRMGRLVLQCIPLLSRSTPWFEISGLYGVMQLQAGLQNYICLFSK